jgi:glycosyltransferase involved in cell wall biosynthesis
MSAAVIETTGPVAFMGTYEPRRCGIASFTGDLARAVAGSAESSVRVAPTILAVTEPSGHYQYPPEVKFELRQNVKADYLSAAEFVNFSHIRLVSIQHEYGIFGGDDGGYILDFVHALHVPAIVTLHTVLKYPSDNQRRIVQTLAAQCAQIIVMSQVACDLLASSYAVQGARVRIIPHGIPVMVRKLENDALKAKFGVTGRRLLLTFGLLSPNKGIETVIRALPEVVSEFPDLVYFVVGATHPVILRREGEAYRTMLEREAEELGVREHVVFRGQFVSNEELLQYLLAADIFVSPYLNEAQVTSGALSYAMGAGAAVVSTPYWHAQELLSHGRGRLFPFKDHAALSRTLCELLRSPQELLRVRDAATSFASSMVWPRIGDQYNGIIERALSEAPTPRRTPTLRTRDEPALASRMPELCLDHLLRMTDDTGIIQHASFSLPARSTGYCVDDNSRALIVAVHADRVQGSAATRKLVSTYLSYLLNSQSSDGRFHNFMTYQRVLDTEPASDDCIGRAIWALGVTADIAEDEGCRLLARDMLLQGLRHTHELGPRGTAQVMLGLVSMLNADPGASALRRLLDDLALKLVQLYRSNARDDWRWFEPSLTYDNAIVPLALFAAYGVTADRASLHIAQASLEFLEENCFEGRRLALVGNAGWYTRGGTKAVAAEQPIDAAACVLAFCCAYKVTGNRHYLRRMREAFAWFLGVNRIGQPLYDFSTGGCRDGIGETELNQNQGAESTIGFLMALLKILELAGEGLDLAPQRSATPND